MVEILSAKPSDIEIIKPYLYKYNLDCDDLDHKKMIVAKIEDEIVGFGRIKQYKNVYEIASIGVVEEHRGKGIGKLIVERLIEKIPSNNIWLTTIIPDFFLKLGFSYTNAVPIEVICKSRKICKKHNKKFSNSSYLMIKK